MNELRELESIQEKLLEMQGALRKNAETQISSLPECKEKQILTSINQQFSTAKTKEDFERIQEQVLEIINGRK